MECLVECERKAVGSYRADGEAELDRLNKGVFVSVGGRQPSGVVYENYLVP